MEEKENIVEFDEIMGNGGSLGLITLNRPKALNALNLEMCVEIYHQLAEWEELGHIKAVVVRGEGDKAFCSGGDIRSVYDHGKSGARKPKKFFWHEYRLNHLIFNFSKPYIALMHGITMGGGAGIAMPASHRVGAENLLFAMPETGIGFFPDVGGSYFLSRCTGKTGFYLALVGARLHIADVLYAGLVDHLVPKESFDALIGALADTRLNENSNLQVSDVINAYSMEVDSMDLYKPHLVENRMDINHCFNACSVEKIMELLSNAESDWSQTVLAKMLEKSPTSLKVTLKELLLGAHMDFTACMQMEYRIAQHFLTYPDFYEGIRSAIIDKNRVPTWRPDTLESLSVEDINKFFAPLEKELCFDLTAKV